MRRSIPKSLFLGRKPKVRLKALLRRVPANPTFHMNPEAEADVRKLRQATAEARAMLGDAAEKLRAVLADEGIMPETPLEAQTVMESAVEAIAEALRRLDSAAPAKRSSAAPPPGGPTRRQGQFLP